jgi:hypothetical protein
VVIPFLSIKQNPKKASNNSPITDENQIQNSEALGTTIETHKKPGQF